MFIPGIGFNAKFVVAALEVYPKVSSDIAANSLFQAKTNVRAIDVKINRTVHAIVALLYFFSGSKMSGDIKNSCISTSKYHECPTH